VRKLGGLFAATCLLTWVAGCSGGSTTAAPATTSAPPSSTSASVSKPKTTAPTFTPVVSPASFSAACPFLNDLEIRQALGQSMTGGSKEVEPTDTGVGKAYVCEYGGGQLGALYVATDSRTVAKFLASAKKDCKNPVMLDGIGEGALHCEPTGDLSGILIAVAKHSHGQLRTAELFLNPSGREDSYVSIAKLLGDRL
jgi:hypothetical protein